MSLRLAIYGKGGSGKSTVAAALSSCLASRGNSVLHMGCDPKADSSRLLLGGRQAPSVMGSVMQSELFDATSLLQTGLRGVHCVEAGGPEPGVGCAGRGITRTFELLDQVGISEGEYDVVLYDVLGDVVCGGFATPLKDGHAKWVLVVASQNAMSLFAANNILKAVRRFYRNGVRLAGIVGNDVTPAPGGERLRRFAKLTASRILVQVPCSEDILEAEEQGMTIYDYRPGGEVARLIERLADEVLQMNDSPPPTPLGQESFQLLIEQTRQPRNSSQGNKS